MENEAGWAHIVDLACELLYKEKLEGKEFRAGLKPVKDGQKDELVCFFLMLEKGEAKLVYEGLSKEIDRLLKRGSSREMMIVERSGSENEE